jgi:WD40 repeat protein
MLVIPAGRPPWRMAFAPDNRRLAVGSASSAVVAQVGLPGGVPAASLPLARQPLTHLSYSPDGSRVLVGCRRTCELFDPAGGRHPWPADWGGVRGSSPDGRFLLTGSELGDEGVLRLIRADPPDAPAQVWRVPQPSRDWQSGAVGPAGEIAVTARLRQLIIWSAEGQERAWLTLYVQRPADFGFTADGRRLVARAGLSLHVWDRDGDRFGRPWRLTLPGYRPVTGVALHPDGRHALAASTTGTADLCDLAARAVVRSHDWGVGPLTAVAVSPDGTLAAAGAADGRIVIWDLDV